MVEVDPCITALSVQLGEFGAGVGLYFHMALVSRYVFGAHRSQLLAVKLKFEISASPCANTGGRCHDVPGRHHECPHNQLLQVSSTDHCSMTQHTLSRCCCGSRSRHRLQQADACMRVFANDLQTWQLLLKSPS